MSDKTTILYIDDEEINVQLFALNFRRSFNVLTASNGNEGLNILEENHNIKVVISDMKMPGMDGVEFIEIAKQKYDNIVYFILTGFDSTERIKEAIETNLIQRYFKKPFNMKEIEKSIIEAVG